MLIHWSKSSCLNYRTAVYLIKLFLSCNPFGSPHLPIPLSAGCVSRMDASGFPFSHLAFPWVYILAFLAANSAPLGLSGLGQPGHPGHTGHPGQQVSWGRSHCFKLYTIRREAVCVWKFFVFPAHAFMKIVKINRDFPFSIFHFPISSPPALDARLRWPKCECVNK